MPINIQFSPGLGSGFGQAAYQGGQLQEAHQQQAQSLQLASFAAEQQQRQQQNWLNFLGQYTQGLAQKQQIQQQQAHDVFQAQQSRQAQLLDFQHQAARDQFEAGVQQAQTRAQFLNTAARDQFEAGVQQNRDVFQAHQQAGRDYFQATQDFQRQRNQIGAQLAQTQIEAQAKAGERVFGAQQDWLHQQAQFGQQAARDQWQAEQDAQGQQERFGQQSGMQQQLFQQQQGQQERLFQQQQALEEQRQAGRNDRLDARLQGQQDLLDTRLSARDLHRVADLENRVSYYRQAVDNGELSPEDAQTYIQQAQQELSGYRARQARSQQLQTQQGQQQRLDDAQSRMQVFQNPNTGLQEPFQLNQHGVWTPLFSHNTAPTVSAADMHHFQQLAQASTHGQQPTPAQVLDAERNGVTPQQQMLQEATQQLVDQFYQARSIPSPQQVQNQQRRGQQVQAVAGALGEGPGNPNADMRWSAPRPPAQRPGYLATGTAEEQRPHPQYTAELEQGFQQSIADAQRTPVIIRQGRPGEGGSIRTYVTDNYVRNLQALRRLYLRYGDPANAPSPYREQMLALTEMVRQGPPRPGPYGSSTPGTIAPSATPASLSAGL